MKFQLFEVVEPKFPVHFHDARDVYNTMRTYEKSDREMFFVLFLNTKNVILDYVVHTIGTVDTAAVYPREVVRSAIVNNASAIIICHNHPSGDPEPSERDKEITRMLVLACQIIGLSVLDHVVIGRQKYFSFADKGIIEEYRSEALISLIEAGIVPR
jgi:DNA repair protein RadC